MRQVLIVDFIALLLSIWGNATAFAEGPPRLHAGLCSPARFDRILKLKLDQDRAFRNQLRLISLDQWPTELTEGQTVYVPDSVHLHHPNRYVVVEVLPPKEPGGSPVYAFQVDGGRVRHWTLPQFKNQVREWGVEVAIFSKDRIPPSFPRSLDALPVGTMIMAPGELFPETRSRPIPGSTQEDSRRTWTVYGMQYPPARGGEAVLELVDDGGLQVNVPVKDLLARLGSLKGEIGLVPPPPLVAPRFLGRSATIPAFDLYIEGRRIRSREMSLDLSFGGNLPWDFPESRETEPEAVRRMMSYAARGLGIPLQKIRPFRVGDRHVRGGAFWVFEELDDQRNPTGNLIKVLDPTSSLFFSPTLREILRTRERLKGDDRTAVMEGVLRELSFEGAAHMVRTEVLLRKLSQLDPETEGVEVEPVDWESSRPQLGLIVQQRTHGMKKGPNAEPFFEGRDSVNGRWVPNGREFPLIARGVRRVEQLRLEVFTAFTNRLNLSVAADHHVLPEEVVAQGVDFKPSNFEIIIPPSKTGRPDRSRARIRIFDP